MPESTISRRPSPLLLVVPLVLTLGGIGLSVMFYLKHYNKQTGTRVLEEKALKEYAEEERRHRALLNRLSALRSLLGYEGLDYLDWLKRKVGDYDFKRAMEARDSRIQQLEGNIRSLRSQIASLLQQIDSVQQRKRKLTETKRAEIAKKLADLAAIDKRYSPRTSELLRRLNEAGVTLMEKGEERRRVQRQRLAARQQQDNNLITIQRQIERLEDALSDKRSLIQKADGRIVLVESGSDRVIINLGRKHRLLPGMRFKVVEKGQVTPDPKDPEGPPLIPRTAEIKGEIEVARVYEDQSTAVVLNMDFSKPILAGDVIFNPGYSPNYQTRFVIVGKIDLNGDGRDDHELAERLIREIGGVVQEKVDVRTDFVLKGEDWPTDDPVLRKRYYRDREQIKAAETLDVSFLSVQRFLDYVGVRVGIDGVPRPIEASL